MTLAPLIANGVLITGISGAEFGVRGFIDGWDPQTGKQLWRRYTIPGAAARRATRPGRRTPTPGKCGGGSAWITGSYDPELDLMYLGHRQPGAVGDRSRARATTSTPRRCWRCGRRPARSSGTTSSRRTMPTTTTRAGS